MTDFHRNIFSYFKGVSEAEQDRDRQLENNTTKALVNTLEHCPPHVVTAFLNWLDISPPHKIAYAQQKKQSAKRESAASGSDCCWR